MKQVYNLFVLGIIAVLCVMISILLHVRIDTVRDGIAQRIQTLASVPTEDQQARMLKKDLLDMNENIKKMSSIVITRDQLVEVVDAITLIARQSSVTVQVPEVQSDVGSVGILEDVHLHMNAVGSPSGLISFLYRLEHLPYMIHLSSWSVDVTRQSALQPFVGVAPFDKNKPKPQSGSTLTVDAVIAIHQTMI